MRPVYSFIIAAAVLAPLAVAPAMAQQRAPAAATGRAESRAAETLQAGRAETADADERRLL